MVLRLILLLSLLGVSAAPAAVATAAVPETYVASASGEIVIGPDGKVVSARLDARGLDARMRADYEDHIRRWTFEPVVEDGAPVAVRVPIQLALRAVIDPASKRASLYIERAFFLTPPRVRAALAPGERTEMPPPNYPPGAFRAGVGAEVMLLVELGEDGRVARAAAREVSLLSAAPLRMVQSDVDSLIKAAERAAARWRIPGYAPGDRVLVPVKFNSGERFWSHWQPYQHAPAAWVLEARDVPSLAAGGAPTDARIRLVTPLSDPVGPSAGAGG